MSKTNTMPACLDPTQITLILMAGGGSSRMGQDKALMPFLGRPLIERVLDRLRPLASEILLSTNRPADYAFLGLPMLPDLQPGNGPLEGLRTCLRTARHPFAAAVACDMPFVNPALLTYELALLMESKADAVVPETPDGLEPLHATYLVAGCLPAIEQALSGGKRKLTGWLDQVRMERVSAQTVARYDPDGLVFWNLNTPEEFRQAETRAERE
jgi:molybdopterin-guanine dinucleotide biosynthesis protein A